MDRFRIIAKNKLNDLPKSAGVYCFKSIGVSDTPMLYIGKATNIQNRVKNHFNQPSYRDDLFIKKVDKIGYLETGSEIEALILEANLIKKHQPKFNVVWRDDKNYFYVAVLQNENGVPYVFVTHQPQKSQIPISKSQTNSKFQIQNSKFQYIGPFVEGTALKKTLRFLRRVFPYYTAAKHPKTKCTWCHLGLCPGLNPDLTEYKKYLKKLILILKGKRKAVLNSLKKEMGAFSKENKFEEAAGIRDRISNLQQVMSHTRIINSEKVIGVSDTPMTLGKILGINKNIHRIECYDVSNMQGESATGSMVVFTDGKPDKSQYRKFHIKIEGKPNDIAMLEETLQRRFTHPEWKYPEVILIDGGIAQLNIAIKVKNRLTKTKSIKVISIAKRNKDLYIERPKGYPEGFIPLKTLPREVYNLVLQLDDEAHRFAIAYHKKLREKNLFT